MLSHRRDPYLWIHLAGLATVPLWLDICLAGLAIGDPMVPPWLELATLALVGTLPILGMQLWRPFYIFSVPGLALRPDKLSVERRQLLTIQRGWVSRGLVVLAAIALLVVLRWLYQIAPIAVDLPWLMGKSRVTGWGICAIAFLFANLFTLVPATVVPLFLTSPQRLEKTPPLESTHVLRQFTVFGLRLSKVLPETSQSAPGASESMTAPSASLSETSAAPETTAAAAGELPETAVQAEVSEHQEVSEETEDNELSDRRTDSDVAIASANSVHLSATPSEPDTQEVVEIVSEAADVDGEIEVDEDSPVPEANPVTVTEVVDAASETSEAGTAVESLNTEPSASAGVVASPADAVPFEQVTDSTVHAVSAADPSALVDEAITHQEAKSTNTTHRSTPSPSGGSPTVESVGSLDEIVIDTEDEAIVPALTENLSADRNGAGSLNTTQSDLR